MTSLSPWRNTPVKTRVIFLLSVFSVFAGIGFANDIIDMGNEPRIRFAISVVLTGLFAVFYAAAGVILRKKFWKPFIPVLLLQVGSMTLLSYYFPDKPHPSQFNSAETIRLRNGLVFDGTMVILTIALGYSGFVHVAVSESRRYLKAETERAKLEGEMVAAREIQRVMVPDEVPTIIGYPIESVYRPAAEVGGDFYQVFRLGSGRTLIVIGDVSGKGLRAAMIVSMVVGMLCVISSLTEEPAEMLRELNRKLLGRLHESFVTCLIVRVDEDGRLTVANAGHLPPYLNGTEIPFSGTTPLGLAQEPEYGQTEISMGNGDRVVLLTDGVPEARKEEGELFGFAKVEALLRNGASAQALAEAAQLQGQNDDVTVIGITRQTA